MPSTCASVPYSSSRPWIASTGQRMRASIASMDQPRHRIAVAVARIHEAAIAARRAQLRRPVLPHGQRAEAFVEEDDQRLILVIATRRDPCIFDAYRASLVRDLDERGIHSADGP